MQFTLQFGCVRAWTVASSLSGACVSLEVIFLLVYIAEMLIKMSSLRVVSSRIRMLIRIALHAACAAPRMAAVETGRGTWRSRGNSFRCVCSDALLRFQSAHFRAAAFRSRSFAELFPHGVEPPRPLLRHLRHHFSASGRRGAVLPTHSPLAAHTRITQRAPTPAAHTQRCALKRMAPPVGLLPLSAAIAS
jgi:hypothetical protein